MPDGSISWCRASQEDRGRQRIRGCVILVATLLAATIVSSCAAASAPAARVRPEEPVPGTVTAHWPVELEVGSSGVIVVEIVALSEFPNSLRLEGHEVFETASTKRRTQPVYVVPGDVELSLEPLPGLFVDSGSGGRSTKIVTAQRGTVVEASWPLRATQTGQSGVILRATRLTRANPEEVMTAEELGLLDIDRMELTLLLDIQRVEPRKGPAAPQSSPAAESSIKDGTTSPDLPMILLVLSSAVGIVQFVLWLIAKELDRRRRAPRLAALLGWLPRTLQEYRNRGSSTGSTTDSKPN